MVFCAFLRTVASRNALRLFVHFYSGCFDTEAVTGAAVVTLHVDQLIDPGLIPHDTLVQVVAGSAAAGDDRGKQE